MWAAYASLQDWQILAPHANLVRMLHVPFQPWDFDGGENLAAVMNSLFCAFGWQRGDIQSAKHAVSFHVPEKVLIHRVHGGDRERLQSAEHADAYRFGLPER